jgi:hypothetical protein
MGAVLDKVVGPDMIAVLRRTGGCMSIDRIVRNVVAVRKECPEMSVEFITTVSSENIGSLEALVMLGLDLGVSRFVFRELFYYPDNDLVDHTRMPGLLLNEHAFADFKGRIRSRFERQVDLIFAPNDRLDARARKESRDSRQIPVIWTHSRHV